MLSDRRKTLRQMCSHLRSIGEFTCRNTIARVLAKYNLRRRVAVRRPLLTSRMRLARLEWAKMRLNWSVDKWKSVVFTDEKIFRVGSNSRSVYVTRLPTEKYAPACLQTTVKHGLQVHVWGAIGWNGVSELKLVRGSLKADGYQATIINNIREIGDRIANRTCSFVFSKTMHRRTQRRVLSSFSPTKAAGFCRGAGILPTKARSRTLGRSLLVR